jgi:hypothetical protein
MGERNSIYLVNDKIYLYAHGDTRETLIQILKNALIRGKERWTDRHYLNRIIFSEMIKDKIEGLTGYGLSSDVPDGQVVLNVDVDKQEVDGISFEGFIK